MKNEKGNLTLTIRNLETGQILKRGTYEYKDMLDAMLDAQRIKMKVEGKVEADI